MPLLPEVALPEKFSIVDGPFGSDLKLTDYVSDGTVPVLTTKNLTGSYDPHSVRFISAEKFEQLKRSKIEGGDILIAKIGSIGKCSIYPKDAPTAIIPANLCKVSVDGRVINNKYLLLQIRSDEFQAKLQEITSATAQPAFSVQRLKTLHVKLPPLNEQHRIVAKLEKLLSRVDAAQARIATIPRILKRFRQSVLAAACSGRLTTDWRKSNPDIEPASDFLKHVIKQKLLTRSLDQELTGWARASVDELFESYGGGTPSRSNPEYWGGKILWVSSGDVKANIIDSSSETITKEGLDNSSANLCRAGTVLVVVRSGILKHTLPVAITGTRLAINQDIKCFDSGNQNLNYWLFLSLKAAAQEILALNREGTTVQSVRYNTLKSFELAIPPLAEQQEIVRRVEALFKTADALETRYRTAKGHVDKLTQSILARAFRGELVTTEAELARQEGRTYEPASVLLERIRQERAQQKNSTKPKPKRTPRGKKDTATKKMFA